MTDTVDPATASEGDGPAKKRSGGLSSMLVADLKTMANQLGISGAEGMKKPQLVAAIKEAQSGGGSAGDRAASGQQAQQQGAGGQQQSQQQGAGGQQQRSQKQAQSSGKQQGQQSVQRSGSGHQGSGQQDKSSGQDKQDKQEKAGQQDKQDKAGQQGSGQSAPERQESQGDDGANRRNRRRRGRDRDNRGNRGRGEPDTTVLEDDVLLPAAGILDVLDNYAFVRTSGYLPGPEDVYVSLSMVRKHGLRRGDAIVGQVRQPREGERKEKFNPLVRVDSINGMDPEEAQERVGFSRLTPLYPSEQLRLESGSADTVGRLIDLLAPLGKGQRGLVVSPPAAGKSSVLQSVAGSVAKQNPECHLMVVLVDERPEEITEFERTVEGEVVSSAFDRPAADHTTVCELAIERAKRLVELGHDVVLLLDGITRLTRAYNVTTQPSGRMLAGGVDSAALHPVRKFFGAARNVENGGSLTILATAVADSGSATDEVILEEFRGTENAELRLRGDLAEQRVFPAIDPVRSGTRREELLRESDEQAAVRGLRRALADLGEQRGLELLLDRLARSSSNAELLARLPQAPLSSAGARERAD